MLQKFCCVFWKLSQQWWSDLHQASQRFVRDLVWFDGCFSWWCNFGHYDSGIYLLKRYIFLHWNPAFPLLFLRAMVYTMFPKSKTQNIFADYKCSESRYFGWTLFTTACSNRLLPYELLHCFAPSLFVFECGDGWKQCCWIYSLSNTRSVYSCWRFRSVDNCVGRHELVSFSHCGN